jgi:hypothetical protein
MKHHIFILLILSFVSCKEKDAPEKIYKKEITFNEALYLIEEHRQFELSNNQNFYNTLIKQSNEYYLNVTNDFIKKEYSVSGSFSEIEIISNKTAEERFSIWEAKINNYFSSLSYSRFLKSKTDNYSNNVNKQRAIELESLLQFVSNDSLLLDKKSMQVFEATEKSINISIAKSNKSINKNLRETIYDATEVGSLVLTAGTSSVVVGSIEAVGVGELAYDFIVPKEDETKKNLIQEYTDFLELNDIDFTSFLNKNTQEYYDKLSQLIEQRRNEKIRF